MQDTTTAPAPALEVRLPHQDEGTLFNGQTSVELEGIDVDASVSSYEEEWEARVVEAYVGRATVVWGPVGSRLSVSGRGVTRPDLHEETVQDLGERLFDDGNVWVVDVGATRG